MEIMEILKNSDLFCDVDEANLEEIASFCRGVSYKAEAIISKEGDEAIDVYVLTDGKAVMEIAVQPVPSHPAIPTAVGLVTKGETFGWSAIFEPHVYTMTTRCLTNCTALAIKGNILRDLMAEDCTMGFKIMRRLVQLMNAYIMNTRLRLVSGMGLVLLGKEMEASE